MENNKFIITDENGSEKEMTILFTFESDEAQYVLYYDENDDYGQCFAGKYNEDGELFPELSEEEWDMCQEMLNTFMGGLDA